MTSEQSTATYRCDITSHNSHNAYWVHTPRRGVSICDGEIKSAMKKIHPQGRSMDEQSVSIVPCRGKDMRQETV